MRDFESERNNGTEQGSVDPVGKEMPSALVAGASSPVKKRWIRRSVAVKYGAVIVCFIAFVVWWGRPRRMDTSDGVESGLDPSSGTVGEAEQESVPETVAELLSWGEENNMLNDNVDEVETAPDEEQVLLSNLERLEEEREELEREEDEVERKYEGVVDLEEAVRLREVDDKLNSLELEVDEEEDVILEQLVANEESGSDTENLGVLADELTDIKSDIVDLEKEQEQIEDELIFAETVDEIKFLAAEDLEVIEGKLELKEEEEFAREELLEEVSRLQEEDSDDSGKKRRP